MNPEFDLAPSTVEVPCCSRKTAERIASVGMLCRELVRTRNSSELTVRIMSSQQKGCNYHLVFPTQIVWRRIVMKYGNLSRYRRAKRGGH